MGSSAARKEKKAQTANHNRIARKASKDGVQVADARKVDETVKVLHSNIEQLGNVLRHNAGVVQQGFLTNDIWFETLRLAVTEIGTVVNAIALQVGAPSSLPISPNGKLDLESYFNRGRDNIDAQIKQREEAKQLLADTQQAAPSEEPTIVVASAEPEIREFGGDYGQNGQQHSQASEATA